MLEQRGKTYISTAVLNLQITDGSQFSPFHRHDIDLKLEFECQKAYLLHLLKHHHTHTLKSIFTLCTTAVRTTKDSTNIWRVLAIRMATERNINFTVTF